MTGQAAPVEGDTGREAYRHFLRTNSAWHARRRAVLQRAGYVCEACLDAEASHVHHTTYKAGWLPPAFVLRALCWRCHERMHAPGDPWNRGSRSA